jgi:hypothetical protein
MTDELVVDHPEGCFLETDPHVHIIRRRRSATLTLGELEAPESTTSRDRFNGVDRRLGDRRQPEPPFGRKRAAPPDRSDGPPIREYRL